MLRAVLRRTCEFACVISVATCVWAQGARTMETARGARAPTYVVAPGDATAPRPVTVYLHGLWGDPRPGCSYFRHYVTDRSWLVCPTAPGRLPGGGAAWIGPLTSRLAAVARARAAAAAVAPASIDRSAPGVLIGFSQGAYEAWSQARARPGRWRGVAFIGAHIRVRRAELDAAGVRRAVFAAGRFDGTWRTLRDTARQLRAEGFDARFVDLGERGHGFAARPEARESWREALAWLEAAE